MYSRKKVEEKLSNYKKALDRLKEILRVSPDHSYIYDAAIQRFEFTYELAWKLMKTFLGYKGLTEVRTPRDTFKEAFQAGIIDNGEGWIQMLTDRNITSHTYNEEDALEIYTRIKEKHYGFLEELFKTISKEI
ncbi:nucleotidyltransferase substrate binding protein, HI0074 family [Anaerovirgula multivorans]|uniref:Nucleotidyltransferase substrate binding protein, HI0074 family n=1 Tax=Anaerovirgula multivorans TaxID=312168 RepID=A0A239G0E8_9FIRM|nr:nucleotidyltransferase substrate binding protein [Anaerovirgula multivorans]SNS62631.1 nucleotidyltransferase substrate binding protein, HI0074 family [Anaerovirgula multivorans]